MLEFSPTQLKKYLSSAEKPPLLLDVREQWEYDITHLSNSLLMPVSEVQPRLNELDMEQEIVVICHHGIRSAQIVGLLTNAGFKRVINLRGGIDAWAKEVDSSIPIYTK